MARDDWRIRIELEGGARGFLERLGLDISSRAGKLADELKLDRLAVSHDEDTVFVYAGSAAEAAQARTIVDEVVIVPNLIRLDQYGVLTGYLREGLGYQPGVDLLEFAYDFRQDNRSSAQRLAEAIEAWNVTAPITIIAHSMGCLIARYYVEQLGGRRRVERLLLDNGLDGEMSAMLLIPDRLTGPAPAVLWLHSSSYDHRQLLVPNTNGGEEPLGLTFVKRGWVVFAPDAAWYGDRAGQGPAGPRETARAQQEGFFKEELAPMQVTRGVIDKKSGEIAGQEEHYVDRDECNRPDTTLEGLLALPPHFDKTSGQGSVTAGNSSQLSDGASATLLMERRRAESLGIRPKLVFRGFALAACEPDEMGIGPVFAVPKLLGRHGLRIDDIGVWELNEAFASQVVYCRDRLGLDPDKLNVNGGSVSIGHPFGMTGSRMVGTLANEMLRRRARYGVVTMCVGGGQGAAGLFEACL